MSLGSLPCSGNMATVRAAMTFELLQSLSISLGRCCARSLMWACMTWSLLLDTVLTFSVSCRAMIRSCVGTWRSKRAIRYHVDSQNSLSIAAWVLFSCHSLAQALIRLVWVMVWIQIPPLDVMTSRRRTAMRSCRWISLLNTLTWLGWRYCVSKAMLHVTCCNRTIEGFTSLRRICDHGRLDVTVSMILDCSRPFLALLYALPGSAIKSIVWLTNAA